MRGVGGKSETVGMRMAQRRGVEHGRGYARREGASF